MQNSTRTAVTGGKSNKPCECLQISGRVTTTELNCIRTTKMRRHFSRDTEGESAAKPSRCRDAKGFLVNGVSPLPSSSGRLGEWTYRKWSKHKRHHTHSSRTAAGGSNLLLLADEHQQSSNDSSQNHYLAILRMLF